MENGTISCTTKVQDPMNGEVIHEANIVTRVAQTYTLKVSEFTVKRSLLASLNC